MAYAVALLLLAGFVAFVIVMMHLQAQRPVSRVSQRRPRPEAILGCFTCALAAQGGDDTLGRHIARDHGTSGYNVIDERTGGRNDR